MTIKFLAWPSLRCKWATTSPNCWPRISLANARPAFRYFDKGDMATIGRMDCRGQG
jgi:hypothetical protein